jgi:hypothetical protein
VTDVDQESLAFLRRSLVDLDDELAAGDLSPEEHARLRDQYTLRLARALRGEDAMGVAGSGAPAGAGVADADAEGRVDADGRVEAEPSSDGGGVGGGSLATTASPRRPSRRPRRRWARPAAWALFVAALAVGGGVLVARSSGSRTAGQAASGEIRQGISARLDQCLQLAQGTGALDAVKCYDGVLADQPTSVEALSYRAWTLIRIGDPRLVAVAGQNLDQAVSLDPTYPDARVFRAVLRRDLGRLDDARADLAAFDALNPPELMRTLVDQMGLRDSLR